jgi:hypothetical protein
MENRLLIAYKNLDIKPVSVDDIKKSQYYVDISEGRGENPIKDVKRRLQANPLGNQQIIFSGYRGCGKSTELNKLQSELDNEFIILHFSVIKELNPTNINYVELFIITMEKLFKIVESKGIKIGIDLLVKIKSWVDKQEIQIIKSDLDEINVSAGANVEASIPLFAKIFSKISGEIKYSESSKNTITKKIEGNLSEFISRCNELISFVKTNLNKVNKKGLLFIIEDLDKLDIITAENLFFNYGKTLTSFNANTIFTYPISLVYHAQSQLFTQYIDHVFELPMLKVKNKDGKNNIDGRTGLFHIITKRLQKEFFKNEDLIYSFIEMSGGCMRDLFRMLMIASDYAMNDDRDIISKDDFNKSVLRIKKEYDNVIAEKKGNDGITITVDKYFDALTSLAKSKEKIINHTEVTLILRHNLCILNYNTEGWYDVHPIVRKILEDRGLIQTQNENT